MEPLLPHILLKVSGSVPAYNTPQSQHISVVFVIKCLSVNSLDHWQSLGQPNIVDEVEGLANMHIVNLGALLTFLHFGKMQGSPDY